MPPFGNIFQKLRLRQIKEQNDTNQTKRDTSMPDSQEEIVQSGAHPTATPHSSSTAPQTLLHYVRTQWMENSILADMVDDDDLQRSPNGPARIYNNLATEHVDTELSSTQRSICYMEAGRIRPIDNVGSDGAASAVASDRPKRYNPPYIHQTEEDWRLRAARTLKGTGSLQDFSADHLRKRHYFQTRTQDPSMAIRAASQQAEKELNALQLESVAVTESAAKAVLEAEKIEDEVFTLGIKTETMKRQMEEIREQIGKRKGHVEMENAHGV